VNGHGQKLTGKHEALIAALLNERTHAAAAAKAGVSEATLPRWLRLPAFRAGYLQARRELVEGAVGRIQAATGQAVDTLLEVARGGAKAGFRRHPWSRAFVRPPRSSMALQAARVRLPK
jgi:hypothetical protein